MSKIDMFKPDDIYNKHFKIIKKIGEGGQAVAYLVHDIQKQQQQKYVLKVAIMKPKNKRKIRAQFTLINSFNHPNIIKAYSSQDKVIKGIEYFFIIMEYAQGGNLQLFLEKLEQEQIYKIYHQLKSAIEYIHTREIIHRDLTLVNILLDNKKNVKVIDFGIATQLEQEQSHIESSILEGTRLYKPQQLMQQFIVTKQNDLWQLGITLIQLVTKKEISQLTNNKHPYFMKNFPEQVFKKQNVDDIFRSMISPLLRKQYKERKFCEEIFWVEPILYQRTLKLMRITNIQLQTSIKQHIQNLFQLNCSDCYLNDQSGKIIRLLKKLQRLDMSGNNLTDIFTYHIDSLLIQLTTLKLAFTDIRDESMQLITKKSIMLRQLDISYTFITSTGIMMLPKLTKLSSLMIWSSYDQIMRYKSIIQTKHKNNNIIINQQCIKQLCKLNLKEICINTNGRYIDELVLRMSKQTTCVELNGRINSKAIEYVCGMKKLEYVYLKDIKKFEIKEFRSKQLKSCTLINCNMDKNKLLKSLSNCNKMIYLNLAGNKLGDQRTIEISKNMKTLNYLNLSQNKIGKQGTIEIAKNMKNLTQLNLMGNNIGNQGALEIANNMKSLTYLNLMGNNIGKTAVMEIIKNMKNITQLNLGNNNIGKQRAIEIAKNMKNLTSLDLWSNNIDNQGIIEMAKNMKNLTYLNLMGNKIGKSGAIEIANNMNSLIYLDLCLNNIGEQGVIEIARKIKTLIYLDLYNNNIGKQGAKEIAKNMKSLTSLNLGANNIGNQGALKIAKDMKNLIYLNLWDNNINNDNMQMIKKMLPNTQIQN